MPVNKANTEIERHDWDRLTGESSKAYAAFTAYRDLGVDRSIVKAIKGSGKSAVNLRQWEYWSSQYRWVDRASAYDDQTERHRLAQLEKERREMNERHMKIGQFSQNVALRRLEKLVRDIEEGKSTMSAADTARLLDIGVKIERLARGEPTDVLGSDGGRIEIDRRPFIVAVREALGFRDNVELGPLKTVFSTSDRNLLPANERTDSLKRFEETPD